VSLAVSPGINDVSSAIRRRTEIYSVPPIRSEIRVKHIRTKDDEARIWGDDPLVIRGGYDMGTGTEAIESEIPPTGNIRALGIIQFQKNRVGSIQAKEPAEDDKRR